MEWVYFIRAASGVGPVKIGMSVRPEARLKTVMSWSPVPLAIVARTPGGRDLECRFHQLFLPHRSHLEWFHPVAEIDRAIAEINEGSFDFGALPEPKGLPRQSNGWDDRTRRRLSIALRVERRLNRWGRELPAPHKQVFSVLHKLFGEEFDAAAASLSAYLDGDLADADHIDAAWAEQRRAEQAQRAA